MLKANGFTIDNEPVFSDTIKLENHTYNIILIVGLYKQLTIEIVGQQNYFLDSIMPYKNNKELVEFYTMICEKIDIIL